MKKLAVAVSEVSTAIVVKHKCLGANRMLDSIQFNQREDCYLQYAQYNKGGSNKTLRLFFPL